MKIGVVLSGCGVQDGSEIHEATLTLLCLDRAGVEAACFAPNRPQATVINHATGDPLAETRNVLAESARIARGAIRSLAIADADALDGLILPGGYGVARNLCDFAGRGAQCQVDPDLERLLRDLRRQGKPIGAMCVAPVLLARVFGAEHPLLTVGSDPDAIRQIETMGGRHRAAAVEEIVIDERLRFVTTPAYMLAQRIRDAATGIERLVQAVVQLAQRPSSAGVIASAPKASRKGGKKK